MFRQTLRVVLALLVFYVPGEPSSAQEFDLLIHSGRLLDGTGNPWVYGDVGLSNGRIVAVGDLEEEEAVRVIDATGLYVAPGFIDAHSHHARGLVREELSDGDLLLTQGVTTIVANPDGGGPLDLREQRRALELHGPAVNVAPLIGHTTIREEVLGFENRPPTADELETMKGLVRQAMEAGSFGLSTGLFYPPARYAETEEIVELARVASEYGGVYQSHIRDESNFNVGLLAAVDEVIEISRLADLPGIVTHIKSLGPPVWGYAMAVTERIDRARAQGLEIFADQYPYLASGPALEGALVPAWAQEGGRDALLDRLEDPEARQRIRTAMQESIERRGGAARLLIRVYEDPDVVGKTLWEVAEERGEEPVTTALELLEVGGAFFASFNQHPRDKEYYMKQPWTMTGSDGELVGEDEKPHPRSYANVSHKLRKYVVEDEVIDLAFAVRSMTTLPATVFQLRDRGVIREGALADIVVFDLQRVRDNATFEDPHRLSDGVVFLLVNGELAIDGGELTGARAGRVLSLTEAGS